MIFRTEKKSVLKSQVFESLLKGDVTEVRVVLNMEGQQTPWASSKQQRELILWVLRSCTLSQADKRFFRAFATLFPAWVWGCLLQWKSGLPKPFSPGFLTLNCPLQLLQDFKLRIVLSSSWRAAIPRSCAQGGSGGAPHWSLQKSSTDLTIPVWWDLQDLYGIKSLDPALCVRAVLHLGNLRLNRASHGSGSAPAGTMCIR